MSSAALRKVHQLKRYPYIPLVLALFASLLPCTSRGDATASVAAPAETNGIALARKAFDVVNSRFDTLTSLQYQAQRRTISEGVTVNEQWSFVYAADGRMRIDYQEPEKRVFVYDGQMFTEYLPTARKALQTKVVEGDQQGLARIGSVLQRLAIDGLRIGNSEKLLDRFVNAKRLDRQPDVLQISGKQPDYEILIDTRRQLLLQFEKRDLKGNLTLAIRATDFQEPIPGVWFPSTVFTTVIDADVKRETQVTLSTIHLNAPIPEKRFDIVLPPDVDVN